MRGEPVRGGFPDPGSFTLPGIEQARAQLRGFVPRSPLSHLVGYRLTQVGSGSATLSMPASPWLQHADGTLEVRILAEAALGMAALTAAPPATEVTTATLSVNYLRAPAVGDEAYVARAHIVHSVRTFTLAEVTVEDAQGRAAVHATGSLLMSAVDVPAQAKAPAASFEEPSYPTPDPYQRPRTDDFPQHLLEEADGLSLMRMLAGGELPSPAIQDLLGCRWVEAEEGFVSLTLEATEWLCRRPGAISPGVLFSVAQMGLSGAAWTVCPADRRVGALDQTISGFSTSGFPPTRVGRVAPSMYSWPLTSPCWLPGSARMQICFSRASVSCGQRSSKRSSPRPNRGMHSRGGDDRGA